jgi:hypothetical protein
MPRTICIERSGKIGFELCSEQGLICHLFELILVIHVNTSNETNHFVEHVFVGISRSHGCYHKLTYHAGLVWSGEDTLCGGHADPLPWWRSSLVEAASIVWSQLIWLALWLA